jgi:uncharacterized membrane protein YdfJ with MMPL/SSD domain
VQQGVRGLVRDAVHHRRVLPALDRGELGIGEVDGTVVIARHRDSVGAATDAARPPFAENATGRSRVRLSGREAPLPDVKERTLMNALLIILAVIAVILLFVGGFAASLKFLLWVGIVLLVIALVMWLLRTLTGRRS